MTLYGRRISVAVSGLVITQPRIHVTVERQADSTQTTGSVDIYNLAPSRAQQIYSRGGSITIEAGYPGTVATIFDGQVQRELQPRENLARITHIELGDQAHNRDTLGGVSSRSYDGPVTIRQIARDFVADMGRRTTIVGGGAFFGSAFLANRLSVGPLDAIPADATITDFAWAAPAGEGLSNVLRRVNAWWFEDDGVVRFGREGLPQPDAPTLHVSPTSGLVGAPLPTDEGAEVTMFLNPQAKIGSMLVLTSESLSGRYRVVGLRHDADNWDGRFTTWTDLREL